MDKNFGNDLVTISDEDGNDFVLEHVDTIEIDDVFYVAFLPADLDENDDAYGLVILKVIEENGEDIFVSIDDDDLLNNLFKRFNEHISNEDDYSASDSIQD